MATYSRRLFAWITTGAGINIRYTVPVGVTTIIRDIEVTNFNVANETGGLAITGLVVVTWFVNLATSQHFQWQGRVVLNSGDQLEVHSTNATVGWVVSGYELQ